MKLQLTSRVQTIVLGGGLERTRHSKYTSSPSLMLDAFKLRPKRSSARGASEIFQQIMNNSTEKTQCSKSTPRLSFSEICRQAKGDAFSTSTLLTYASVKQRTLDG